MQARPTINFLSQNKMLTLPWIVQLVQRLFTGLTVRGSNSMLERFSAPVQTGPEGDPVSHTMAARPLSRG